MCVGLPSIIIHQQPTLPQYHRLFAHYFSTNLLACLLLALLLTTTRCHYWVYLFVCADIRFRNSDPNWFIKQKENKPWPTAAATAIIAVEDYLFDPCRLHHQMRKSRWRWCRRLLLRRLPTSETPPFCLVPSLSSYYCCRWRFLPRRPRRRRWWWTPSFVLPPQYQPVVEVPRRRCCLPCIIPPKTFPCPILNLWRQRKWNMN